MIKRKRTID